MSRHGTTKLKQVFQNWPKGTVATQAWLDDLGVSRKLANWHVNSGWLERFGPRAYVRPDDTVSWLGGLYSLQTQLDLTIHAGGETALGLRGKSHFLPLGTEVPVFLISDGEEHLPKWFRSAPWPENIDHCCLSLFHSVPSKATVKVDCGGFTVDVSSEERAIIEQMRLAGDNDAIEQVHRLMAGLNTLRPDLVQELLENCRSVKAKRLFLWSAEETGHAWFSQLNLSRLNLGKGRRQLYKGGKLNRKYEITVPEAEVLPNV
jgi:hypothetical protein